MSSPATAEFLRLWRYYDTSRAVLIRIDLADPSAKSIWLAYSPITTPDGQFWQPLLLQCDPIEAPGEFCGASMQPARVAFKVARAQLGWQAAGQDITDALGAYRFIGATCTPYLWTPGATSFSSALPGILNGVIDDYSIDSLGVRFIVLQRRGSNRSVTPRYADRGEFARIPDGSIGHPLGILIGDGRSRPMRGDWAGSNNNVHRQRLDLRGGMIPSAACVLVDEGQGGGGSNTKAKVVVAGHPVMNVIETGNLGNLGLKLPDATDTSLLDVPSADVFVGDSLSGFDVDDNAAYGYAFVPFIGAEIVSSGGDNPRHLLEASELQTTRLDYDATKRNVKLKCGAVANLGVVVDVAIVAGYRTSSAADSGQQLRVLNNKTGGGTIISHTAGGLLSSLTPTSTKWSLTSTAGDLDATQKNTWDFSQIDFFAEYKAGTWTASKVDFYFAGLVVQYRPKQRVEQMRRTLHYIKKKYRGPKLRNGGHKYRLYENWYDEPSVLAIEGQFYAQPRGWPDCDICHDPIDAIDRMRAAIQAVYAGTAFGGWGLSIRAGYNDKLHYSVTGAPANPYAATIAAGAYESGVLFAAAVQTALNADTTSHGKTFTVTYSITTRKFTVTVSSGSASLLGTTLTTPAMPALGFAMGGTIAVATSATAGFARVPGVFWLHATTAISWLWSNASTTAEGLFGWDATDDSSTQDTLADHDRSGPLALWSGNQVLMFNDGALKTATMTLTRSFTGGVSPIERAPDIAQLLLVLYGLRDYAKLETGAGVHGSFVDARANLKTWRQLDMTYFRAITETLDVHSLVTELAEQSCSMFMLNRFTDRYNWIPWRKGATADYPLTIGPDDVVTPGHLQVTTTGQVNAVTNVRVSHLFDAAKRQYASASYVGHSGSAAGQDYGDVRDEFLTVKFGVNDRLDVFEGLSQRNAILTPGTYTPAQFCVEARRALEAADPLTYGVGWGFQIIAGDNDAAYFGTNLGALFSPTITPGVYTGESLAAAVAAAMTTACGETITVTFSRATLKFTVTKASGTLTLRVSSGPSSAWTALGWQGGTDRSGSLTYTSDAQREEERFYVATKSNGTFTIMWDTGTNGLTGTKLGAAQLLGFFGYRDTAVGAGFLGDSPKNAREQACTTAALRYGSKREISIEGTWLRSTDTARELRNRLIDLLAEPLLQVQFESTRVPDLQRGQVIQFSGDFDQYLACPKKVAGGILVDASNHWLDWYSGANHVGVAIADGTYQPQDLASQIQTQTGFPIITPATAYGACGWGFYVKTGHNDKFTATANAVSRVMTMTPGDYTGAAYAAAWQAAMNTAWAGTGVDWTCTYAAPYFLVTCSHSFATSGNSGDAANTTTSGWFTLGQSTSHSIAPVLSGGRYRMDFSLQVAGRCQRVYHRYWLALDPTGSKFEFGTGSHSAVGIWQALAFSQSDTAANDASAASAVDVVQATWAGRAFHVVSVRQNLGPLRWDTEVTAIEAV